MEALFSDYEAIRKSGLFDPEHYVKNYPDVTERNVDPLVHYLEEGAHEGRDPHPDFDTGFYLEQCKQRGEEPANPLLHYLLIGAARGFKTKRDGDAPAAAAAPDGNVKAPILVAVESLGVAGTPDGGSRLSINGWALATAAISEISAAIDGTIVGRATYGLARPDIGRLYPGRDHAGNSGFILSFDLPRAAGGTIEPLLTVRTAGRSSPRTAACGCSSSPPSPPYSIGRRWSSTSTTRPSTGAASCASRAGSSVSCRSSRLRSSSTASASARPNSVGCAMTSRRSGRITRMPASPALCWSAISAGSAQDGKP